MILFAALACARCGGSEEPGDPNLACLDDVEVVLDLPEGVDTDAIVKEAGIEIEQTLDHTSLETSGVYRLLFFDTSVFEGTPAATQPEGQACVRVIGEPVIEHAPGPLSVRDVEIDGLAIGKQQIAVVDDGLYVSEVFDEPILTSTDVAALASEDSDASVTFPSFELSVAAAEEVVAVETRAVAEALEVRWAAGAGDFVELRLTTTSGAGGPVNQIICRVTDDGCHRVSSQGVLWLLSAATTAALEVTRQTQTTVPIGDDALATLRTMQGTHADVSLSSGSLEE